MASATTCFTGVRPSTTRQCRVSRVKASVTRATSETGPILRKPTQTPVQAQPPIAASEVPTTTAATATTGVTIEYQRQQAKELQKYFKGIAAAEQAQKLQRFGWIPKNEIANGRWVMMGFAIGLLTEYATGVDFIDQLKLVVSYLGILDLD